MEPLRAIRARVRSLGPGRLDALIAIVFLVEGVLEAALLYPHADHAWWAAYRTELEARFRQDEILIRASAVERL